MSLTKRRISRRALGVVVGASLLVLGLEAPAFAAAPVISGFTPDSGSEAGGCVLVVTGTGLDDFATATWTFEPGAIPAADYVLISDTEAWVVAPAALAPGVAYNLKVVNDGGTSTSTGTFLATSGAGNCAPTITSITPNCGSTNDRVVIAGTNLLLDGALANDTAGGTVQFTPFATNAAVVPPDSDTATQLTRFVSADAADGPIKVIAGGGTVFSTESFLVPPPDCPLGGPTHSRSISLSLRKHLVARGAVTVEDDTTECIAAVPVKIQRRKKGGGWKNVGSTTTSDTGAYKRRIKDRPGKYRAVAPAVTLEDTSVCSKAVSPRVRHRH
jgi:hypothetical protein